MFIHKTLLTQVSVTGLTVYGLAVLFLKAWLILMLARTLANQFEYSPASIRHTIWLIALLSLGMLPLLAMTLPSWHLFSIDLPASALESASLQAATSLSFFSALSAMDWLLIIYLAVVISRIVYLFIQIANVALITSQARIAGPDWYRLAARYFETPIKIKMSDALGGPVTWGKLSPVILLPESSRRWSQAEKIMVLQHELGHIRRADWLVQLLGHLVAALYWPVPGITQALNSLSLEAECACDDTVLADDNAPPDYAALLLRQAKIKTLQATVALGKSSQLRQRISHIVNAYADRAGERKTRCLLSIGCAVLLLPFASIQAAGTLPQYGPLAGMILVPLTIARTPPGPMVTEDGEVKIGRPDKPGFVNVPPVISITDDSVNIQKDIASQAVPDALAGRLMIKNIDLPGVNVVGATELIRPDPVYPLSAKRRGIEGRVVVQFDIDTNGYVINPKIIAAKPSAVFNQSVLQAMQRYRYEPYRVNGQAFGLQSLSKEFHFQLTEKKPAKRASTGDTRAGQKHSIDSS